MLLWVLAIMACTSSAMADLKSDLADLAQRTHEPAAAVMAQHMVGVSEVARQWPVIDVVMQEAVATLTTESADDEAQDLDGDDCGDVPWYTTLALVGALPLAGRNPIAHLLPLSRHPSQLLRPPRLA